MADEGEEIGSVHGKITVGYDDGGADAGLANTEKKLQALGKAAEKETKKTKQGLDSVAAAATAVGAAAPAVEQFAKKSERAMALAAKKAAELKAEMSRLRTEATRARTENVEARNRGFGEKAAAKSQEEEEKRLTRTHLEESRIREHAAIQAEKRITMAYAQELRERARISRTLQSQTNAASGQGPMASAWQAAMNRSIKNSNQWYVGQQLLSGAIIPQQSRSQGLNQAIAAAAWKSNANYLGSLQQQGGGTGGGGGRRGGSPFTNFWNSMGFGGGAGGIGGRLLAGAASGLGFGIGAYGIGRGVGAVVESTELATSYDRQEIAARRLAGSQERLNQLLDAYSKASGGAVDKATALENVTRLQAVGFAKNAEAVERFTRGTRGASIALGKPQTYIDQETQLAISNTSVKRLDQIGLGVEEVENRIESLRDANSGLTREMAFGEAVIGLMNEKFGGLSDTIEGQATGLEKLKASWRNLFLAMGQGAQGPVNRAAGGISGIIDSWTQDMQQAQKDRAKGREFAFNQEDSSGWSRILATLQGKTLAQYNAQRVLNNPGVFGFGGGDRGDSGYGSGTVGPQQPRFLDEQMSVLRDFETRRADIERQFNADRLAEINSYEQQRTSLIINYSKMLVREEQDFARQRHRSRRDYDRARKELEEDAAKRDAESVEDYNERVSNIREDSAKRVAEIEERYNEEREKSAKEHQDRLLKAAGQLDAIAVLEERKRYRRENEDREEAHKKQREDERENVQEALEDAKKALDERLEDARKADEERLADMADARAIQLADEDEDRAIRLARAAEDHQDQLNELDKQHAARMRQIEANAALEREQWQKEFEQAAIDNDIYIAGLTKKREELDKKTLEWFDLLRDEMEKDFKKAEEGKGVPYVDRPYPGPVPRYDKGGAVRNTGLAQVHKGEFVLSREMLSGSAPVPSAVSNAISNSNSSKSIVVAPGAIQISAAPGMEEKIGDIIEDHLVRLLERVS